MSVNCNFQKKTVLLILSRSTMPKQNIFDHFVNLFRDGTKKEPMFAHICNNTISGNNIFGTTK